MSRKPRPSDLARAGRTIGTLSCPWCGGQAEARRNEGKHAYVYCPGCGLTTTARTGHQSELIERAIAAPVATPALPKLQPAAAPSTEKLQPAAAASAAVSPPAAPPRRAGLWEQLGARS